MNTFIRKVSIFTLLLFIIFIIGLIIPDRSTIQSLHYSIIDKQRLLKELDAPRLILVGGSNVSFGIDSKKIEDDLNINVINAGIVAGYGMKFITSYVGPFIKTGDIVILIPEYELFFGKGTSGNGLILLQAIDAVPDNLSLLSLRQVVSLCKHVPQHSIGKIKMYLHSILRIATTLDETDSYWRRSFNRFGDVVTHWNKPGKTITLETLEGNFTPEVLEILEEFRKTIEMKNGRLYITYPSLSRGSYKLSETKIRLVEQKLIEEHFVIFGDPERYSFPDNMYFDSKYHLNKKGVDLRTELLLQDLKNIVD